MTKTLKDWLFALFIGGLVAWVVASFEVRTPLQTDVPAPTFAVTDLAGQPMALEALRGQTVIVNFWASWCGPCRQEIPDFSRFAKDHPDVRMIGLAAESGNASEVRSSAQRLGIDYPVALAEKKTLRDYGVSAYPTTIIIDPTGQVQTVHVGPMSYRQLERAVSAL